MNTAMKPQEVTDALKLTQLKDKIWFVVPSCATTGEGLLEGLVRPPPFSRSPSKP
jgi:ADP-ribosylation factor protein 6